MSHTSISPGGSGRTETTRPTSWARKKCGRVNSCLPSMKPRSHPGVEPTKRPPYDLSPMPERFLFWKISPRMVCSAMSFDPRIRYAVALDKKSSKHAPLRPADLPPSAPPRPAANERRLGQRVTDEVCDTQSDLRSFALPRRVSSLSSLRTKIVVCLPI